MGLTRRLAVAVLMLYAVGQACGGDGGSPIVPNAITIVSGNNQSGQLGDSLAVRLKVAVTGSDSRPYVGGRVTWVVTNGSAALAQGTDTTDAAGESENKLTIGVTPGDIAITATVTGVTPAAFTATALDPCDILTDHAVGSVATGTLTGFDCQFGGPFFTDFYRIVLPAQQGITVSMSAGAYDTYLEQYHLSGPFIAVNDDRSATDTNSNIEVIAATGTYVFAASTFRANITGPYSLTSAARGEALGGPCPADPFLPWITRGVALSEQIDATNCSTGRPAGGTAFSDRVLITLAATRGIAATLASGVFPPRLELYQVSNVASPTLVASANGAGSAVLNFTPTTSQIFRLEITTQDTAQTGAYTLNVTGPSPVEAAQVMLVGPEAWRAVGDRPHVVRSGKVRN